MTSRKLSRWKSLRLTVQTIAVRDIASGLAIIVVIAVALALTFGAGLNVGAHIWRPGWICGETLKGAPWCAPAPKGDAGH